MSWTIKAVLWADGERHTDAKPRLSHWWSEPAAGLRSVTPLRAVWTSLKNVFSLFMWHWPFYTWAISPFSLKRLFKSSKWTKKSQIFSRSFDTWCEKDKIGFPEERWIHPPVLSRCLSVFTCLLLNNWVGLMSYLWYFSTLGSFLTVGDGYTVRMLL